MHEVRIDNRTVGPGHPCVIVAEIGINHNGSVTIAKRLINMAVKAGCDAVKFQKRTIDTVYPAEEQAKPREIPPEVLIGAIKRGVLSRETVDRITRSNFADTTTGDQKRALEFGEVEYREIDAYCRERGIMWFASPWDEASVDFLERFGVPCHKVASACITDHALLRRVKATGKPAILSTGMSTMEEVQAAVDLFGGRNVVVLHAVSTYPAENADLNLTVIETLKRLFPGIPVGYSGHERGVAPSVFAAVLGASIVERHITLDRTMYGSDQAASLENKGLEMLVEDIRMWEKTRGDGIKRVIDAEIPIRKKLRRV